MRHDSYDDSQIARILASVQAIAVPGASANPSRASHGVTAFLVSRGYAVYPVNPGQGGGQIAGRPVHARLADVPVALDMIDVFRQAQYLPALAEEVLALDPLPAVFWTQLGIRDDAVAARLEAAGIEVVMNRCPIIEFARLGARIEALRKARPAG